MYLTWYQLSALHCWIWIGWLLFIALNHSFRSVSDQIMGFEFQRVPNTHQHPCVHVTACCRAEQLSGGDWAVDRQSDRFVPLCVIYPLVDTFPFSIFDKPIVFLANALLANWGAVEGPLTCWVARALQSMCVPILASDFVLRYRTEHKCCRSMADSRMRKLGLFPGGGHIETRLLLIAFATFDRLIYGRRGPFTSNAQKQINHSAPHPQSTTTGSY